MAGYSCMPGGCASLFIAGKAWLCVVCSPMHATLMGVAPTARGSRPRHTIARATSQRGRRSSRRRMRGILSFGSSAREIEIEPLDETGVGKASEPGRRNAHDVEDRGAEALVRLGARIDEVTRSLEAPTGAAEQYNRNVFLAVRAGGLLISPDHQR